MRKTLTYFLITIVTGTVYASELLPKGDCPEIIKHNYYTFCYSTKHRQAKWTFHKLTLRSIKGKAKRQNDYREDFFVADPVSPYDYKGTGFDRGHLVPAADMKLNPKSMSETFYMTNMSPQTPGFNRGIWKRLEQAVRRMIKQYGDAYVISAGVLNDKLQKISKGVSIPKQYFKIIYFPQAKIMKGYLFKNKDYKNAHFSKYQVKVDLIESITGLDFFPSLPLSTQYSLESTTK